MKSPYRYFIDHPRRSTHQKECAVLGWLFHQEGVPIKEVRLRIGDDVFPGKIGIARPDVAKYFHQANESYYSGINVPVELKLGKNRIKIEVLPDGGEWGTVGTVCLKYSPLIPEAVSLLGGLARKIFSKKHIYFLLSKKTRGEYFSLVKKELLGIIHNICTHKKLSGLGHLVHHAPRPIKYEKYPKKTFQHMPKITIVTPSYNQGSFLEATIQSVLSQNYSNLEYIVIDGNSQDNSPAIIEKYRSLLGYAISEPDQGQSHAIQKGFEHCTGGENEIMAYLNSDDLFFPGVLHFAADFFEKNPRVDMIYGHRMLIDDNGKEVGRWFTPHHNNYNLSILDYVPQETMFWRRKLHDKIGGIDPNFHFAMDWDFLLRAQEAGAVIKRVPYFLGCFRVHAAQKTNLQINTIGEQEMLLLRNRSHHRNITDEEIIKVYVKSCIESIFTRFLFFIGIRL